MTAFARAASTLLLPIAAGCTSQQAGSAAGDHAIGFYQRWLGSQWAWHCNFQPSCSNYGKQSIDNYGLLPGSLMTADRLMRDHNFAHYEYASDEEGRPVDPPANNARFEPVDGAGEPDADALAAVRAQDEAELERAPLAADFDEDEQLAFADHLFADREFERARVEYLRLLRFRPQTRHALRCHERVALCLARAKRTADALAEVGKIGDATERERLRALVLRTLGRSDDALAVAQANADAGALFTGLLALEANQSEAARQQFGRLDGTLREPMLERVAEFDELPGKSRWLAGSLSAVLPGAGQLYAGAPEDAGVAFLTNGILIGGTVAAARHDEEATAIALGFVAFGFYAGNVYGGINAAAKHDQRERDGFLARTRGWLRQSGLWLSVGRDGDALGLYFEF